MKTRILFVDDEEMILQGLKRMLRPMKDSWEMAFAINGFEALELMEKLPFDVVVSDMRMREMDGAELLGRVRKKYPQVVRIILSGQSDSTAALKSVKSAHQYLAKPCVPDVLKNTINRSIALRDLLKNDKLQRLISSMDSLPSAPILYSKIIELLGQPECSIKDIGETIAKDLGMTAKILQLVNSSFYGIPRHISYAEEAVSLLGIDTVKALILSIGIFSKYEHNDSFPFKIESLLNHSIKTGAIAKKLALMENLPKYMADETFISGVLHDVGKLVLAANMPEQYSEALHRAKNQNIPETEVEREIFGTTHSLVGAYLIGLWGMPDIIVELVAFHHSPAYYTIEGFIPLTIVHMANGLEHCLDQPDLSAENIPNIDYDYLDKIGLTERIAGWYKIGTSINYEGQSNE
ncbi:MAG: HDOD domain-containing protein [Proteobacteria bacterium]|nr:HDOD domain-containing protein [Pseudomonadota bacterium]